MPRYTIEQLWEMEDQTDWERVDREDSVPDEDSPELTDEDMEHMLPARDVLPLLIGPEAAAELLKPKRGPQKAPRKLPICIRLSVEVIEHFKADGPGWQSRIDAALKEWIKR